MDLSEHTHTGLAGIHRSAAAGVIGGVVAHCPEGDVLGPELLQNHLDHALYGVEIHTLAIGAQGEELLLRGQTVLSAGEIDPAQLVQAGGLVAIVIVPGEDLQHGGQGGGAHDGGVLPQGVQDLEGLAAGVVLRPADLIVVGGGDEGIGDDLVIAAGTAHAPQLLLQLLGVGIAALGGLAPLEGAGDVVIAVEPGHLLGQVVHPQHIAPPGGHGDLVAVDGKVQLLQDADHLVPRHVGAQQGVDLLRLQGQDGGVGHIVQDVDDAVHHLAGTQQLHQLAGPVHGGQGVHGVQALLELGAGLGAHTQGQSALADAGAIEIGGLEHHVGSVGDDLAVLAAHDARQAHGPGVIGDDQVAGSEGVLLAVQSGELLPLLCPADDDLAALYIAIVKGVHGLAILQHHIVGDVHDVVDGAHAHAAQPLPHPLGGGGDLHVAHHAGGVAGAQVCGGGLHVQQFHQAARSSALHLRGVQAQLPAKGGGGLPGQTNDGQAVGAVGGDLKLHHMVVQTSHRLDVVPGLAVLTQDEDAVGDAVGELPLLGVEVGQGAVAVCFGVVSHQIALVEVGTYRIGADRGIADVGAGVEGAVFQRHDLQHFGAHHGAVDLVPGLDVGGNRRPGRVDGLIVAEQGGGGDGGVGEVPLIQAQLAQRAQHTVGHHTPQLALFDLLSTGQGGLVQGHGDQVAHVDVPGPGDDLHRLGLAHVQLAHPHVVRVGVALHGQDAAHHHVAYLGPQVLGDLYLRAGQGHGLGKFLIIGINSDELVEPFTA